MLSTFYMRFRITVSPDILKLKDQRGTVGTTECALTPSHTYARVSRLTLRPAVNFSEFDREPSGQVNLIGRVK